MIFIYLILSIIFCSIEHDIEEYGFFIVTDREIKEFVTKDKTQTELFKVDDFLSETAFNYIWDTYFPKPIIYGFNCVELMKSKSPISLHLEGITGEDKVLFTFTLGYDLNSIILSDFFDTNNMKISNAKLNVFDDSDKSFMLSREVKNINNIKASFEYLTFMKKIEPFYNEILIDLFRYIKNIDCIAKSVKSYDEKKSFEQAVRAKNEISKILVDILQNASSLRIPVFNKSRKFQSFENFITNLNNIFHSLADVVKVFLNEKNKEGKEEIILDEKVIVNYIKNEIIQNDSFTKCVQTYGSYITELKNIEAFVNGVFLKGNTDAEIIFDCDVKKINEFVEKYFFIIRCYCEIMCNSIDLNVFDYCFNPETSDINASIKDLYNFFSDKFIADRLLHFIQHYEQNNKDFLVFSQTDYFKNTLSYRIIVNLELLEGLYSSQNTLLETEGKFLSEDKSQNNLENLNIITALKKAWKVILQDEKTFEFKNFESLLSQDKLPTPYIYDESFYKPVFFENNKQEDETKNLPNGDLGVFKNKLPSLKGKPDTNYRTQNEPKISNPVGGEPEDFSK